MLFSNKIISLRNFSRISQVLNQKTKPIAKPNKVVIHHEKYGINYTKLDIQDKELMQMMTIIKSRKKQIQDHQIIVEGKQLICEAIESDVNLNHLLFANIKNAEPVLDVIGNTKTKMPNLLRVPREDLSFISILQTCPGLIGIFDRPHVRRKPDPLPITVICDNVREPSNVGAVIRIANALPAIEVMLPKGNADQWEAKAIRGSMGSVFHIPTHDTDWTSLDNEEASDVLVLIADNSTDKYAVSRVISYDSIPESLLTMYRNIYVILGGESHGISDEARNFASKRDWRVVNIDLDPTVNSLNTSNALAVILFEIRRKLKI
jgi:16S rRNA (guanosine(1370)-2'-O)-methyltransferase